ncbi:MAG: AAA family ATPase [Planctomycetia bacterium]|nr:AAA family ATPase [Planctomycetia bacterium]
MLKSVSLNQFTVFKKLKFHFSPGINVFIGENGTGKTHLLKVLYAAGATILSAETGFSEKLNRVFLPSGGNIGRLVKRNNVSSRASIEIQRTERTETGTDTAPFPTLRIRFSNHARGSKAKVTTSFNWRENPSSVVYIPVKDMLANAPGFRSLCSSHAVHFEEVYLDIVDKAFFPKLQGPATKDRKKIEKILSEAMSGKVIFRGEEFFLQNKQGKLEFTLLAEGFRKIGLLWLLLQNGSLLKGSALFWDEPETNLNPKLMKTVVSVLLAMQKMGVQIFLATHNYTILRELDLQMNESYRNAAILYHSLYRDKATDEIGVNSTKTFQDIDPNAIVDTFGDQLERDMKLTFEEKRSPREGQ